MSKVLFSFKTRIESSHGRGQGSHMIRIGKQISSLLGCEYGDIINATLEERKDGKKFIALWVEGQ